MEKKGDLSGNGRKSFDIYQTWICYMQLQTNDRAANKRLVKTVTFT